MSVSSDLTSLASDVAPPVEKHVEIKGVGRITVKSTILPAEPAGARSAQFDVVAQGDGFVMLMEVKASQPSSSDAAEALRTYVLDLQTALAQAMHGPQRLTELTELISPAFDPPPVPVLLQARRNAQARQDLLSEFGGLSAAQIAKARKASTANPSALASRWRKEGRIFGVTHRDKTEREKTYFPAFQFDDQARPIEAVRRVLAVFATHPMTEWEIALWFTTPNGWLDDDRPVDLLHDDPDAVVAAAKHEVGAIAG